MRIKALSNIAKYASKIDSNEIYLEQTLYLSLQTIYEMAMGAPYHKKPGMEKKSPVRKSLRKSQTNVD